MQRFRPGDSLHPPCEDKIKTLAESSPACCCLKQKRYGKSKSESNIWLQKDSLTCALLPAACSAESPRELLVLPTLCRLALSGSSGACPAKRLLLWPRAASNLASALLPASFASACFGGDSETPVQHSSMQIAFRNLFPSVKAELHILQNESTANSGP